MKDLKFSIFDLLSYSLPGGIALIAFLFVSPEYKTHKKILGAGKWALECLANLDKLPTKGATIFVGAPKVEGATGGLVRVIAFW